VFLAAAGQRTRHIELGTAMIPIGYEMTLRPPRDRHNRHRQQRDRALQCDDAA
jgi:hypothetical protein